MPIVLKICQFSLRKIKSNPHLYTLVKIAFILTLMFTTYFELFLPTLNDRYTAACFDVCSYITDFMFFVAIERYQIIDSLK